MMSSDQVSFFEAIEATGPYFQNGAEVENVTGSELAEDEDLMDLLSMLDQNNPRMDSVSSRSDSENSNSSTSGDLVSYYNFETAPNPRPEAEAGLRECAVCGERAGKHNYYGGRVCPSCRAFFRRAVQSKYYEIFFCMKSERCEMNIESRRSCQFCRFKKCLASGMRIAWVLPEGERKKRFNKVYKKKRKSGHNHIDGESVDDEGSVSEYTRVPGSLEGPALKLTLDDAIKLGKLCEEFERNCHERITAFPDVCAYVAKFAYFGETFTLDLFRNFHWMCDQNAQRLILRLEDIDAVPLYDQNQLLKHNTPLVVVFKEACFVDEDEFGFSHSLEQITKSKQYDAFEPLRQSLEACHITNKPKLEYSQLYTSPWQASYEDELRHRELLFKIKKFVKPRATDKPDKVLTVLGKCMLAFNTDLFHLQRRDIVEGLQMRCLAIMRNYLKIKYNGGPQASSRFAEGMRAISYAKEILEIEKRRLPI